jgi:hypothetical protein
MDVMSGQGGCERASDHGQHPVPRPGVIVREAHRGDASRKRLDGARERDDDDVAIRSQRGVPSGLHVEVLTSLEESDQKT